jgi:hypothetical protein
VNIGVAALSPPSLCSQKDSFFGDLHGQGDDSIDFTERKVVTSAGYKNSDE